MKSVSINSSAQIRQVKGGLRVLKFSDNTIVIANVQKYVVSSGEVLKIFIWRCFPRNKLKSLLFEYFLRSVCVY